MRAQEGGSLNLVKSPARRARRLPGRTLLPSGRLVGRNHSSAEAAAKEIPMLRRCRSTDLRPSQGRPTPVTGCGATRGRNSVASAPKSAVMRGAASLAASRVCRPS